MKENNSEVFEAVKTKDGILIRKPSMEVKKILLRKHDGIKYVVIPKNSELQPGEWVKIEKLNPVVATG